MKKLTIAASLIASLALSANASEWGYGEHHGPAHWGAISKVCAAGKNQSPIDVNHAATAELSELKLNYSGKVTGLLNNGHTLQAKVEGNNQLLIDGTAFTLKQFHLHTPSENLLKGNQYPLEAHFVHADKDGNLAVVAVMYEVNKQNAQLASLTQSMPKPGQTSKLATSFPVADMLPEYDAYYRFNGSLTTPPCSEGVRWFVLEKTQTLSEAQRAELNRVMGNNNRPVQALNARKVMHNR